MLSYAEGAPLHAIWLGQASGYISLRETQQTRKSFLQVQFRNHICISLATLVNLPRAWFAYHFFSCLWFLRDCPKRQVSILVLKADKRLHWAYLRSWEFLARNTVMTFNNSWSMHKTCRWLSTTGCSSSFWFVQAGWFSPDHDESDLFVQAGRFSPDRDEQHVKQNEGMFAKNRRLDDHLGGANFHIKRFQYERH